MRDSLIRGEGSNSVNATGRCDATRALNGIALLGEAASIDEVLARLRASVRDLGGDAAVFMSFVQDDATLASYRSLVACDPAWSTEYAQGQWFEHDPWLRHAMHDAEPVRSSELVLLSELEEAFVAAASQAGFASAVVAPAPSTHGSARVGVLVLGSAKPGFFESDSYPTLRVLARALSMELHAWLGRSILRELVARSRITAEDIALLRHEAAGHGSKLIAAALNTEPKTIDCRFQRVSSKLGAANRRAAVRLARLYGLI